jgi:hypothetical protein
MCAGSTLLLAEDESTSIVKRRPCWSVIKPVRITFSRIICSSPERLNLDFLLREKTCRCAHHTFRLEFPNCLAIIIINYTPAISPHVGGQPGRSSTIHHRRLHEAASHVHTHLGPEGALFCSRLYLNLMFFGLIL